MSVQEIVTIGVYGFTPERFFSALVDRGVDLFCDLRARRGVRGRDYAFANARRLEARLREVGIAYEHFPALAPTREMRSLQRSADTSARTAKRTRETLDPAFVESYTHRLATPDASEALVQIEAHATRPLLFCVERTPTACHRSVAAAHLATLTGASIVDLLP